jgi:hypothetical protein
MDLVYFYRHIQPGELHSRHATEELRYSLRSMATNYADLGEVHVFGGRPPWFSPHVHHYPVRQAYQKHENTWRVWRQIAAAAGAGYLPDEFLIMNDDYFLMRPWAGPVPVYVSGMLSDWLAARAQSRSIADTIERTQRMVEELGGPARHAQLGYELHVPLRVHGPTLAALWPRLEEWTRGGRATHRVAKRSAYGNLAGPFCGAEIMSEDCKVIKAGDPIPDGPWLSTSDDAFAFRNTHEVGRRVRAAFPRRSRFEALPSDTVIEQRNVRSGTPAPRRVTPRSWAGTSRQA